MLLNQGTLSRGAEWRWELVFRPFKLLQILPDVKHITYSLKFVSSNFPYSPNHSTSLKTPLLINLAIFCTLRMAQTILYKNIKKKKKGVPVVAQWLTNPTRNHEVAGSVPALAQWVDDLALP